MEAMARTVRAQILLARGKTSAALADTSKAVEFGRRAGEAQVLLPALAVHTRVLFEQGAVAEARAAVGELLAAVPSEAPRWWVCDVVPVLVALGNGPELVDKLAAVEKPTPWEAAAIALLSGCFGHGIELYESLGARPHEAEARLLAARHAGEGDAGAREHLERALDFFRSVQATARIDEAQRLLGAAAELA